MDVESNDVVQPNAMQSDGGQAEERQDKGRPKPSSTRKPPAYLQEYACNAKAPETILTPFEVCCIG